MASAANIKCNDYCILMDKAKERPFFLAKNTEETVKCKVDIPKSNVAGCEIMNYSMNEKTQNMPIVSCCLGGFIINTRWMHPNYIFSNKTTECDVTFLCSFSASSNQSYTRQPKSVPHQCPNSYQPKQSRQSLQFYRCCSHTYHTQRFWPSNHTRIRQLGWNKKNSHMEIRRLAQRSKQFSQRRGRNCTIDSKFIIPFLVAIRHRSFCVKQQNSPRKDTISRFGAMLFGIGSD